VRVRKGHVVLRERLNVVLRLQAQYLVHVIITCTYESIKLDGRHNIMYCLKLI